jgi:tetratricopeptide (TPR) repeat protein
MLEGHSKTEIAMNANEITRRQAIAIGSGAILVGAAGLSQEPKGRANKSWVGEIVLPKQYAMPVKHRPGNLPPEPDGSPREFAMTLEAASYSVKSENDARVEVFGGDNFECWAEKADLVLLAEAVEYFTEAVNRNGQDHFALLSRGWAHYLLGRPEKAIADFDAFLKLAPAGTRPQAGVPERWEGLVNRGLVLAEQGQFEEALADLNEAVEVVPVRFIARTNRGFTYELMGEYDKAIADYRDNYHMLARNNLAWLLATCPDERFRGTTEAVETAGSLCQATRNREGMFLDTLAAAYAEAGRFDDAVKTQELALKDKSFVNRYGDDARKRLQLYKDRKPYRTERVKKK